MTRGHVVYGAILYRENDCSPRYSLVEGLERGEGIKLKVLVIQIYITWCAYGLYWHAYS